MPVHCEVREKTNKMQQLDVYYQHFINMFRGSLCPFLGEQDVFYCTWCAVVVLLDVVGSGCGALRFRLRQLAPYNAAPHKRHQPHPAEPAQHTTCSNTRLFLLKMGIMMTETCWENVDNKHLTVASCWFSLSLHIDNSLGPLASDSPCIFQTHALCFCVVSSVVA